MDILGRLTVDNPFGNSVPCLFRQQYSCCLIGVECSHVLANQKDLTMLNWMYQHIRIRYRASCAGIYLWKNSSEQFCIEEMHAGTLAYSETQVV
jgi:hypothetical protein